MGVLMYDRVWPVPGHKRISAGFDQLRPLSRPVHERTHVHGAIDIPAPVGTPIVAPESGELYAFFAMRGGNVNRGVHEVFDRVPKMPFDLRNHYYWYDIYGGVLLLRSNNNTHIITHSYINQLMKRKPLCDVSWRPVESANDERWPVVAFHTFLTPIQVGAGELIGHVGNAGFSTGAHIHYEIHEGSSWDKHEDRIDPEAWLNERDV